MHRWAKDAIFYHLYPLGCLGAPERNPFDGAAVDRLSGLHAWIWPASSGLHRIAVGIALPSHSAQPTLSTHRRSAAHVFARS